MIGRELAKAKIKKLRKMTTAAGCTPEEALSAAARIAELMAKHRMVTENDIGDLSVIYRSRSAEEAIHRPAPPPRGRYAAAIGLLLGILLLIWWFGGRLGVPVPPMINLIP
jgi:hypothetical protein